MAALLALGALGYFAGRALQSFPPAHVATGLSALLVAVLLALSSRADLLLHRAPELGLLLPAGLSARQLVALRLFEGSGSALIALAPIAAALVGLRDRSAALPLAIAALLLAPTLASLALLLARLARVTSPLAAAPVVIAIALAATTSAAPGQALLDAATADRAALASLAAAMVVALSLLASLGPLGQSRALDRATRRSSRARGPAMRAIALLARPLGAPAAWLVARDLVLLARGGFVRGTIALLAMPFGLAVVAMAARDPSLGEWELLLAGLLVSGALASGAGFLFGVDFPRARPLQVERVQPLRARDVLRSRLAPALLLALAMLLGAAAIQRAMAPRADALALLIRGALLCAAVVHDAVGQGLAAEATGDPSAGAAAFPLRSAAVVIALALALTFHPLGILLYPLLGWMGAARAAVRAWERSEVAPRGTA